MAIRSPMQLGRDRLKTVVHLAKERPNGWEDEVLVTSAKTFQEFEDLSVEVPYAVEAEMWRWRVEALKSSGALRGVETNCIDLCDEEAQPSSVLAVLPNHPIIICNAFPHVIFERAKAAVQAMISERIVEFLPPAVWAARYGAAERHGLQYFHFDPFSHPRNVIERLIVELRTQLHVPHDYSSAEWWIRARDQQDQVGNVAYTHKFHYDNMSHDGNHHLLSSVTYFSDGGSKLFVTDSMRHKFSPHAWLISPEQNSTAVFAGGRLHAVIVDEEESSCGHRIALGVNFFQTQSAPHSVDPYVDPVEDWANINRWRRFCELLDGFSVLEQEGDEVDRQPTTLRSAPSVQVAGSHLITA